jgi:hypothetical protein
MTKNTVFTSFKNQPAVGERDAAASAAALPMAEDRALTPVESTHLLDRAAELLVKLDEHVSRIVLAGPLNPAQVEYQERAMFISAGLRRLFSEEAARQRAQVEPPPTPTPPTEEA